MSLAEKLVSDFNELPEDKKIEVIDFVEFLKKKQKVSIEELMDNIIDNTGGKHGIRNEKLLDSAIN